MPRAHYHFNRESLSYTRVQRGIRYYLQLALKYLLASIALAVVCYIIFSFFAETPREWQLGHDNSSIATQLHELNSKYDQLAAVLKDIEQRDNNIYRLIFEAEPEPDEDQLAEYAIDSLYAQVKLMGCSEIARFTARDLTRLAQKAVANDAQFDALVNLAGKKASYASSVPGILPLGKDVPTRIASPFGVRIHPFYKVLKMHTGLDFAAPVGSPVHATASGTVRNITRSLRGYGNTLILDHGNGYSTLYAHLEQVLVQTGQKVTRGTQIATVGSSGMSMAPHLHYEVRQNGTPIDPLNYLFLEFDPLQLADAARIASQTGQSLD